MANGIWFLNRTKPGYQGYTIMVPNGAPALAMSYFCDLDGFQVTDNPQNIVPLLANEKVDVAVMPTNVGVQAIVNNHVNYDILCTVTFGNFYVASTGNDANGIMESSDYIVSFQPQGVANKIFQYVYDGSLEAGVHYVSSAQEASKCLKMGKNLADDGKSVDYVLIAEPAYSIVASTTPNVSIYANIQEIYKEKSGGYPLFQASVFVRKSLDKQEVQDSILGNIRASVNNMLSVDNYLFNQMNKISNPKDVFGIEPEIAQKLVMDNNKMGLGCEIPDSEENIEGLKKFLKIFGINNYEKTN